MHLIYLFSRSIHSFHGVCKSLIINSCHSQTPAKMWRVMVRPWCWEVAGPWTAAAWFTTPAVPPHRGSRMVSLFGSISLHPPGANRDQSVSLLISGTSVAAVKKERKKKYMQIRLKGNYSRCRRQNFSGFLLLGLRHNPSREGFWASLTHVSSPDRH